MVDYDEIQDIAKQEQIIDECLLQADNQVIYQNDEDDIPVLAAEAENVEES